MSEWTGTRTPPTDQNGVYLDLSAEFSTVVIGGEYLSIRNAGPWERDDMDIERARRIAAAMDAPVFVLRKDWRRAAPFRWETDQ